MPENILPCKNRSEFRQWLSEHAAQEKECWLVLKRGKPTDEEHFWYLDAVEEALCFGWIDSTLGLVGGVRMQRFSPRSKASTWTELNKARAERLERLGLMKDAGRAVLPKDPFIPDPGVEKDIRDAGLWEVFQSFPPLYQRVRGHNLAFTKRKQPGAYKTALDHFINETRKGKTYGEWNDYGRLLDG